jgi:hypothetical protein
MLLPCSQETTIRILIQMKPLHATSWTLSYHLINVLRVTYFLLGFRRKIMFFSSMLAACPFHLIFFIVLIFIKESKCWGFSLHSLFHPPDTCSYSCANNLATALSTDILGLCFFLSKVQDMNEELQFSFWSELSWNMAATQRSPRLPAI